MWSSIKHKQRSASSRIFSTCYSITYIQAVTLPTPTHIDTSEGRLLKTNLTNVLSCYFTGRRVHINFQANYESDNIMQLYTSDR